ncbi:hypothetical protein Tsubulata_039576 [Turnera subulata]|uniref:Sodium/calcium exchanger membrane region domain-containing protein n=1 Tax=Turnera subulata TaxID=218843 RepID=A0A9Q0FJN3_9ROSI|nr:hypothetical protein Tsubulata_039576 [Turnera subulata]
MMVPVEKVDLESDEEIPFSSSPNRRKVHPFETVNTRSHSDIAKSWIFNRMQMSPLRSIYIVLIKAKINILLPFGPLAILLHYLTGNHGVVFLLSMVGITPLAERLGYATEQLAFYTGPTVGGLLNATFGNATEMIISIYALKSGMIRVVQQSLLGSILSNMLLVLGCAFFSGGIAHRNKVQVFNKAAAMVNSGLLLMAVMGIMFPAVLHFTHTEVHFGKSELSLSRFSSCVMLIAYGSYLFFQLKSQPTLYNEVDQEGDNVQEDPEEEEAPEITQWESIAWLAILTLWVSVLSGYLVDAIQGASDSLNMPVAFISVILLPIVGNAAEHASAIMFAMKDKLDITLGVAIGSSTQISMFVIPFCVVVGWFMGQPMDLNFQLFETATLFITVLVVAFMLQFFYLISLIPPTFSYAAIMKQMGKNGRSLTEGLAFNFTLPIKYIALFGLFCMVLSSICFPAFIFHVHHSTQHPDEGLSSPGHGLLPSRRNLLNVSSDALNLRLNQARKLVQDALNEQIPTYAAHIRRVQLQNSKLFRVFSELSFKFRSLVSKDTSELLDPHTSVIDVEALKQYENEVKQQIKATRDAVSRAKDLFDGPIMIQKLKDEIFAKNEQLSQLKKDAEDLSGTAAKVIPGRLHCLAMRLMQERSENPDSYVDDGMPPSPVFEDPNLYHYAIFSDNVIAASVVVNSLVQNAKEPWKHVLHIVTDKTNFEAMRVMMFKLKERNDAHIEIKAVEDYKFLNSSYVPVLRQRESAEMQKYYSGNRLEQSTKVRNNMKFRNPKYISIMNHLRFYLPEMYPALHKILFLDDDVVVQKDLTGLWEIDMDGKVNGAVYTCRGSFHRLQEYLNFSHPLIKEKFDPKACAWAYGMNLFDLDAWRRENCTEEYHYWQNMNEERTLWRLGTLPPGLITFYKTTQRLDKSWHFLGLGYRMDLRMDEIHKAAVVHFNGNHKPWLDSAFDKFKPIWRKYADFDLEFMRECDFWS